MKYRISIDKHQFEVRVDNLRARPIIATVDGETFEVWPEGQETSPTAAAAAPSPAPVLRDTALASEAPLPEASSAAARLESDTLEPTPAPGSRRRVVRAPLPGVIIALSVKPGDTVAVGQELCVLEAMKMKNPVRATRPGVIRVVHVTVGQTVTHRDLLVEYSD